jgi:hypothetical protein
MSTILPVPVQVVRKMIVKVESIIIGKVIIESDTYIICQCHKVNKTPDGIVSTMKRMKETA